MKFLRAHHIPLFLLITILCSLTTYLLLPPRTPLSPLNSTTPSPSDTSNLKPETYIVLGFAPYWNLKKIAPETKSHLDYFAYFALHLGSDGTIYQKVNRREEEPGYTNYKRLRADSSYYAPGTLMLTYMPIDQAALTSILNSTTAQKQAIATILTSVRETQARGINIDFEPLGDITPTTRAAFTRFITDLHHELSTMSYKPLLTLSVYPSAGSRPRLWELSELAPVTDYIVVMTYDYTLPGSSSAGPNAPLRDSSHLFEHTVVGNIAEIVRLVPSRQILLGIPLYGYEWTTNSTEKYAPTGERGVTASLERIEKMINDQTLTTYWDRNTLTPYGITHDDGSISQIYFENAASLNLKLELVKSAHLGGIALWALGYENNVPWLWPTIRAGL